jgi:TrmH family RNA methyltransferase
MLRVTSRHNPKLKETVRLVASSRDRRKAGKCVLEGEHLIEAYASRYGAPETLLVTQPFLGRESARALVERFESRTIVVPDAIFDDIAVLPAGVGLLAVVATPQAPGDATGDFVLLLDDVQDPGNVGSMLRSAAAAGVSDALLSPHCAFAWSPKVLRAGMGAHFHLSIREAQDLAGWSRHFIARGGRVVAMVSEGGEAIYEAPLVRPLAVAIGNEGAGLSPTLRSSATDRVTIPMPGGVESLNAAAAAAVVLLECVRRGAMKRD